jgi:GTP-binding protein EngB required for normal cell division
MSSLLSKSIQVADQLSRPCEAWAAQLVSDIYDRDKFVETYSPIISASEVGFHAFVEIAPGDSTPENPNTLYVVHRGSATQGDWKTNLTALKSFGTSIPGSVHHGFYSEIKSISDSPIRHFLEKSEHNQVVFCGHSKGAAMAALQCVMFLLNPEILQSHVDRVSCVGFACPLFCDKELVDYLQSKNRVNGHFKFYCTSLDLVPAIGQYMESQVIWMVKQVASLSTLTTILQKSLGDVLVNFHPLGEWIFQGDNGALRSGNYGQSVTEVLAAIVKRAPSLDDARKNHLMSTYFRAFCSTETRSFKKTTDSILGFRVNEQISSTSWEDLKTIMFSISGNNLDLVQNVTIVEKGVDEWHVHRVNSESKSEDVDEALKVNFHVTSSLNISCRVDHNSSTGVPKFEINVFCKYIYAQQVNDTQPLTKICVVNNKNMVSPSDPERMSLIDVLSKILFQAMAYNDSTGESALDILVRIENAIADLVLDEDNGGFSCMKTQVLKSIEIVARFEALRMDNNSARQIESMASHEDHYAQICSRNEVKRAFDDGGVGMVLSESRSYQNSVASFKQALSGPTGAFWTEVVQPLCIPPLIMMADIVRDFRELKRKGCNVSITSWFHAALPAVIRIVLVMGSQHLNIPVALSEWQHWFVSNVTIGSSDRCYVGRVGYMSYILSKSQVPTLSQLQKQVLSKSVFELEEDILLTDGQSLKNQKVKEKIWSAVDALQPIWKSISNFDPRNKDFWADMKSFLFRIAVAIDCVHRARCHLKQTKEVLIYGPEKNGKSTIMFMLWGKGQGGEVHVNTKEPAVFRLTNGWHLVDLPGANSKQPQHRKMQQRLLCGSSIIIGVSTFLAATNEDHLNILKDIVSLPIPSAIFLTKTDEFIEALLNPNKERKVNPFLVKTEVKEAKQFSEETWLKVKQEFTRRKGMIDHFEGLVFPAMLSSPEIVAKYIQQVQEWSNPHSVFSDFEGKTNDEVMEEINALCSSNNSRRSEKWKEVFSNLTDESPVLWKNGMFLAIVLALKSNPDFALQLVRKEFDNKEEEDDSKNAYDLGDYLNSRLGSESSL